MKKILSVVVLMGFGGLMVMADPAAPTPSGPQPSRGLKEVYHENVELTVGFWGPRLKTAIATTLPHALDCLERDGHVTNFDKAAGKMKGTASGHSAFDSDLYKTLEGAMCLLQHHEDDALRKRVDDIIDRILAAQQDDGYLVTYFILKEQELRWERLRVNHQMYNAGHYFEMAVEHEKLTGDKKALNSAKRFADHIDGIFGPNKRYDVDGHQEIELALVKLYRATGERRYLDLAKFFLDERGYQHGMERKPFDPNTPIVPPEDEKDLPENIKRLYARCRVRNGRMQDHKPIVEQMEAVGHAVRAGYMYAAMADIVRFTNDADYEKALDSVWNDVVSRKMYVNGGVGTAQYHDEGFGDPYLLPNKTYCESCANIANVLWQYRMALLKGETKYADVMELALYNSAISGIAIEGNKFFYQNPLFSKGGRRSSWIGLSCCPSNLARFIPQVGGFVYAKNGSRIMVNLFANGEASIRLDHGVVHLVQETEYPWQGRVRMTVKPDKTLNFELCLRIPGWAVDRPVPSDLYRYAATRKDPVTLKVNGEKVDAAPAKDGYVHLTRSWTAGDTVELDLLMPVRRIYAHEKLKEDNGMTALMRGPIVYCLEGVDHPGKSLHEFVLPRTSVFRSEYRPDLLGGVTVLLGQGLDKERKSVDLVAVPYYAWANRDPGDMAVWIKDGP